MDHAIKLGLRAEEIVYTFQLPHPRCNFCNQNESDILPESGMEENWTTPAGNRA